MKKIVSLIAVLSLVIPSVAYAGDYRYGVDSNRYSPYYGRNYGYYNGYRHHHDNGVSNGAAVAIGLGALILGAAIAGSTRNSRNSARDPNYSRSEVCQDIIENDYYGNRYVSGRKCWYEN